MSKKTIYEGIGFLLTNLFVFLLFRMGYNSSAPYLVGETNINEVFTTIVNIGLLVSSIGVIGCFLYEVISKKSIPVIIYFIITLFSFNPFSYVVGFVLYKEKEGTIKSARLALIVLFVGLLLTTWFLNITRVLSNFMFSANSAKKEEILNFLYIYKYLLCLGVGVYIFLPDRILYKARIGIYALSILAIPVGLLLTPVGLFAHGQTSIIGYELNALKEDTTLPKDVLLRLEHVGIGFGKGLKTMQVVDDLNLDIYKGETLGLVGESGSGKTTIGRAIIGVNKTNSGKIIYHDKIINGSLPPRVKKEVKKGIQMIFQDPAASLNERTTVDYIISEGLRSFHLYSNEKERNEKVNEAIRSVGLLPEHLSRYPHEFSGGQRQRIGIARAIVMRPEFIIADEPISALDVSIRAQVLNLLKQFQKEYGLTYLFIAHDLSVVRFVADRIAVIYKGKIVELAESEELFLNPTHPYTKSLLSAIPIPDPSLERNKKIIKYVEDYNPERQLLKLKKDHYVLATEEELKEYKKNLKK